jgi:magnesium transporter
MLSVFPVPQEDKKGKPQALADAIWVDLLNPTGAELRDVEEAVGAPLPSLGALSEIETSSRLRNQHGVLYMSTPSAARHPEGADTTPPIGFVLSADRLVTVRFMTLPAVDAVAASFAAQDAPKSSLEVFTLLCEDIVDRVADALEHLAGELNGLSTSAFRAEDPRATMLPAPTSCCEHNCARWGVWETASPISAMVCRASDAL